MTAARRARATEPQPDGVVQRRTFLGASALGIGSIALGGMVWLKAARETVLPATSVPSAPSSSATTPIAPVTPSRSPSASFVEPPSRTTVTGFGALGAPDRNGIRLPPNFTSRVVARSGSPVGETSYRWHPAPDGGACFADGSGWIYVSNSEVKGVGGASAIAFRSDGRVGDAYRILGGTDRNCSGGSTPWGTWLSCEEIEGGRVFETDPRGIRSPVLHEAMGVFKHEAAAVDPVRRTVYLTEDEPDSCFYRFTPSAWPDLRSGRLDVLCAAKERSRNEWRRVPDPLARKGATRNQVRSAIRFAGGEGAWYADGGCWFTTKYDNRVWRHDTRTRSIEIILGTDAEVTPVDTADAITMSGSGEVFVAEDGSTMRICTISEGSVVAEFLQIVGQPDSEITGPAFSPDGSRLYFSSQRGLTGKDSDGMTYEVRGPFTG